MELLLKMKETLKNKNIELINEESKLINEDIKIVSVEQNNLVKDETKEQVIDRKKPQKKINAFFRKY